MTDTTIITDPIAYGRERDIDLSAARRGYLNGIETALRIAMRVRDRSDSHEGREAIWPIIGELAEVLKGKEVVL